MNQTRELKDAELEQVSGAEKCCIGHCPGSSGGGAEDPQTEDSQHDQIGGEQPLTEFVDD
jgi:hypothetical protein